MGWVTGRHDESPSVWLVKGRFVLFGGKVPFELTPNES